MKKISDDLAKKEKKLSGDVGKSKKALGALVKKDPKMAKKATKDANKKHATLVAAHKKVQGELKKAADATKNYKTKVLTPAQKKYEALKKKASDAKKQLPKDEVKKPKGKTALSIMNKIVLKEKKPLFNEVTVSYKSTTKEFGAFIASLGHEANFWKALIKEVKADKKKKALVKGANMFLSTTTAFSKACAAQAKLVKGGKAKSGKKAFRNAVDTYKLGAMKSTVAIAKAMKSYETKANVKVIKGYVKAYKKIEKKQVKLNQKHKGGSNTLVLVLGLFGMVAGGAAIWYFMCRNKKEE